MAETTYAVAAFRILLLTGCRLSEIQTLEWGHVDLEQKELRLSVDNEADDAAAA